MSVLKRVVVVLVVLAAGAWAYYSNVAAGKPSMDMSKRVSSGTAAFPVVLATAERGKIAGSVTYTGTVAPFSEEDIYPRVTGRIVEMAVYPGDVVRAGQVVARLDDVELTSRVREAEAMLATSQANRLQMEADVTAAHHGMVQMEKELAMAEAEAGYQQTVATRDEQLYAKGAISQQDAENSRAMAAASQAKVEAARAKLEQARAMYASAKKKLEAGDAMVAQSGAASRTAQIVRDYVNIVAPSAGYVVKRLVAPGVLVQPGMAILKLVRIDQVRLQANVGERDLPLIRVGSPVLVAAAGGGRVAFPARVTSVFPYVDQGARTAVVEAVVENNGRRLLTGQYVQMQFVTGERMDAVTLPLESLIRLDGKARVWTVKDDKAEPREVLTGLVGAERVEILRGLAAGEQVVARGHEGLYAGAQVIAMTESATAGQVTEQSEAEQASAPSSQAPATGHADHGAGTVVAQAGGGKAEDLQLSLTTIPANPRVGNNRLRIEVKDASGAPVTDAKVSVNTSMPGMAGPKATAKGAKDPGVYETIANLAMGGTWTIEVSAARQQGGSKTTKFNIEVK